MRQPPPSGIAGSFLTSTCTIFHQAFPLIAQWFGGRTGAAVASVEAAQSLSDADACTVEACMVAWAMNPAPRGGCGTAARPHDDAAAAVRAVAGPARAVLETRCALGPVPRTTCAPSCVDLEPLRDGGHAPAFLDLSDHLEPMRRGERRVGVLGPSNVTCEIA